MLTFSYLYLFSTTLLFLILFHISYIDISKFYVDRRTLLIGFIYPYIESICLAIRQYDLFLKNILISKLLSSLIILIVMLLLSYIAKLLIKRESLGQGDAMLASMGASWIGLPGISIALSISFLIAGIITFIKLLGEKRLSKSAIAFCPYLSFGIFGVWILRTDFFIALYK